jgi:DNA segregation ATPase FtsK/SpoIIIE, S-DNA-T family
MGFPHSFNEDMVRRLISIATNGPRCGVNTLVVADTSQSLPYGLTVKELEQACVTVTWNGQKCIWPNKLFENATLELDLPPPQASFSTLLRKVGEAAKNSTKVTIPFKQVIDAILPRQRWWAPDQTTREEIRVPLGKSLGAKSAVGYQELQLGRGTTLHALVVGKTGAGKTNLLHVIIVGLALTYSPEELELYLVDLKAVGFAPFATHQLPHVRVVAMQSDREFGLSVLQALSTELKEREKRFIESKVPDITYYRNMKPQDRMPRSLLIIDEFQELFTYDDEIARQAASLLEKLVRLGRAFGIHVILCSQTLSGTYTHIRSTISQMEVRLVLRCEEADSQLVLSQDNPAANQLTRQGEAIYNTAHGLKEGNNFFQSFLLPKEELDNYLDTLQQLTKQRRYNSPWQQVVFDGSTKANVSDNQALQSLLEQSSGSASQQTVKIWLGDPIAIKEPTSVLFRPLSGNNLLLVGQQEEDAIAMLSTALLTLMVSHAPDAASFYVIECDSGEVSFTGLLRRIGETLAIPIFQRRTATKAIAEIASKVEERMDIGGNKTPIYLIIHGLQRARDLRPEETFSFSAFGEDSPPPNPAKQFATILREGPELGIHTLVWCDTRANAERSLTSSGLREFEQIVAFQMSANDSIALIQSQDAGFLDENRAILYSDETGRKEKFRPYSLPDETWLQKVLDQLCKIRNIAR